MRKNRCSQVTERVIWVRPVALGGTVPIRERKMSKCKDTKEQLTTEQVEDLLAKPWLSVPQAGAIFGLGRSQAYEAARRGEIETFNMGRLLRAPTPPIRKKLRFGE